MTDPSITLELRAQPCPRAAVKMRWRNLLFLHYSLEPQAVQSLLPNGLRVDCFPDAKGIERAWIGLVAFEMLDVRPRGLPTPQRCADFPETNVRTYCIGPDGQPGVWFFSLDAANPFACAFARRFYSLPYREATMRVSRDEGIVNFESARWWSRGGETNLQAEVVDPVSLAVPGSLEFFLAERYLLYSRRGNQIFCGQVHHDPYPLQKVKDLRGSSSLFEANELPSLPFEHMLFSSGVDVLAGPIKPA